MDGIEIRVASIKERRHLRMCGGNDQAELWPGYRSMIWSWAHGLKSFVAYAKNKNENLFVARVKFIRSVIDPSSWHYGYLFTDPRYRRRGIANLLMQAALKQVLELKGVSSACYIDRNNLASQMLNERLGYSKLPVVRLHCDRKDFQGVDGLSLCRPGENDIRKCEAGIDIIEKVSQSLKWINVLIEEFVSYRRIFPWDRLDTELLQITARTGNVIGIARCGKGYANVVLSPESIGQESLASSTVALLQSGRGIERVFIFAREESVRLLNRSGARTFDYVYFNDNITEAL